MEMESGTGSGCLFVEDVKEGEAIRLQCNKSTIRIQFSLIFYLTRTQVVKFNNPKE